MKISYYSCRVRILGSCQMSAAGRSTTLVGQEHRVIGRAVDEMKRHQSQLEGGWMR